MTQVPPPVPAPPTALRHSGPGIASFIVSGSSFFLGTAAALIFSIVEKKPILAPFCTCGLPTALVGIILGIVGLSQRHCKKLFAYLGLALGVLVILINVILMQAGYID